MKKLLSPLSILTNGSEFQQLRSIRGDSNYTYRCDHIQGKPAYAPLPFDTKRKSYTFDKYNKIWTGSQSFVLNLGKHEDGYIYDYIVWIEIASYLEDRWLPMIAGFDNYGALYKKDGDRFISSYDIAEIKIGQPFGIFQNNLVRGRVSYRGKTYPLDYQFIDPEVLDYYLTEISDKLYSSRPKHKLKFADHNLAIVNCSNLMIDSNQSKVLENLAKGESTEFKPGQSFDELFKGYESVPIDYGY